MYSVHSARSATMFGVTPGTVPYVPPQAPQKNAPSRYRSKSSSLVPFRDESKLVALRYDQTVQAEPPIPIPPPRSSRRPPPRPISCDTARSTVVIPPPRPAPPTEQHPALRTISSPRIEAIEKRDSGHSPATPSSSWTIREDSETDDEDPFAYENIQKFPEIKPLTLITRSASPSIYGRVSESNSRVSAPSISPALSDGETVSPTSPTTPSSNFSRFARSFSLRSSRSNSSKSSFTKMKRLRKKPANERNDGGPGVENPGYPLNGQDRSAPKSLSGTLSPASDPHGSPIISTTIPTESLLEDDFMTQLSFSKRGSIIFGAKHPRKHFRHAGIMADQESAFATENAEIEQTREPRSFPLVHSKTSASANTKDAANASGSGSGAPDNTKTNSLPPTPRQPPPSVRVISAEAEKESQKVRSLYESGEGLNWEDGAERSSIDGRPQPLVEHPPRENENDAANEPVGNLIPLSASISSPQDKDLRRRHELAGGIEDWEGVHGEDVDRYGFISVRQPRETRPATAYETTSVHYSERKQRNVLVRKDAASLSLRLKRGPRRKLSARSLNTQASGLSTASHRSALSAIRQATNLLPYNRDRKLLDEAGDILASHPGLSQTDEDGSFEKRQAESKLKETERAEKWRRMAKIIKAGSDGQGMVFDFDMNHPKLIERTWKGIPDCWRSSAWYSFLSASAKASNEPFATDDELKVDFHRLIDEPSPDDGQIDLDVPRTINQHIMFRRRYRGGQRLLFRVLHALSLYFPETGYVQGMAPLAATFLSYFDEDRCFIMLVRLWKYRGLNRMYQSGFVELMAALKDFEQDWLGSRDVASKLSELCIDPTAYATKWYLTLFNLSIPFAVQLRVWDAFLLLGSSPDVPSTPSKSAVEQPSSKGLEILHAASLAIVDTLRPTLLDSDFENAMKSLTSWIPIKDGQGFMDLVQLEYKRHQSKQKI
ncbi:rab-GTPase-TBC domain-containing protein [Annulohypoxylon maeteangense]|uniref:rab-GTPase-TBC domain-containing protein n=1 Tax=Annulohypoxylon maeteangense TaxID=1927788 RepID=UPI002008D756|nr:rab-GTPase-TBC domain-containing protein [Annulohypoxylon maeteangense]KAI0882452.1 rab-GTPase-TBC domain-containing protein [Annulohypoxylon maeteangense]